MTSHISSQPKFQWNAPMVPKEGESKTSVKATFVYGSKKYQMTVSYDKKGLQSSFGIDEKDIDSRIKAIVNQLDLKDLSTLVGVAINASLTDSKKTFISKKSDGVTDTIEKLQGQEKYSQLCATVSKVVSIFSQLKSKPKDEEELEKKTDFVEVKVEEEESPSLKKIQPLTFAFEEVDETDELPPKKKDSDEDSIDIADFQGD